MRQGRASAPVGCGSSSPSCRSSSPVPSFPCRLGAAPSSHLLHYLLLSSPSSHLLQHLLPHASSPSSLHHLLLLPPPSSRSWVSLCGSPSSLLFYVFAASSPSSLPLSSSLSSLLLLSLPLHLLPLLSLPLPLFPHFGFCRGYSWTVTASSRLHRWCVVAPLCLLQAEGQHCSSWFDVGHLCLLFFSCPGCRLRQPLCPRSDLWDEGF